jgi:PIN domain nuclease of toxin-antitoxin system
MRYYLDTNLLVFILFKNKDDISSKVSDILTDYSTLLYASSISVQELILLFRIGKLMPFRYKYEHDLLDELKKYGIEIIFFNKQHLDQYTRLQIIEGHKDMNDHAIIAQAMSDKIPLISSDHEFKNYTSQGLTLVFNKR